MISQSVIRRGVDGLPTMFKTGTPFVEVYWLPRAQRVALRGQYPADRPGARRIPPDAVLVGVYDDSAKKREVQDDVCATIEAIK